MPGTWFEFQVIQRPGFIAVGGNYLAFGVQFLYLRIGFYRHNPAGTNPCDAGSSFGFGN